MSHVPRPGRFLSSRPDSPRPTDSLPPLYPPSAASWRTERTTTSIHKPVRNSPQDLTGQITRERSKWPKVTGGGYGDVWGGVWQNGTETCKVRTIVTHYHFGASSRPLGRLPLKFFDYIMIVIKSPCTSCIRLMGWSLYNRFLLTSSLETAERNRSLEKTRPQEYCAIIWNNCGLWFRIFDWDGFALDE